MDRHAAGRGRFSGAAHHNGRVDATLVTNLLGSIGLGAASGFVVGTAARLACAISMIAIFAFAVFSRIGL